MGYSCGCHLYGAVWYHWIVCPEMTLCGRQDFKIKETTLVCLKKNLYVSHCLCIPLFNIWQRVCPKICQKHGFPLDVWNFLQMGTSSKTHQLGIVTIVFWPSSFVLWSLICHSVSPQCSHSVQKYLTQLVTIVTGRKKVKKNNQKKLKREREREKAIVCCHSV